MRHAMLSVGACLALLAVPGPARPQDDSDRTVRGKKASEWMNVLKNDKNVRNRERALLALNIAGPQTRKVFESIGNALRGDPDETIRKASATVLGGLGQKAVDPDRVDRISVTPAVESLASALRQDKSAEVRDAAAYALGRIGTPAKEAVPALAAALKDMSPAVRASAAEALSTMGTYARDAVSELAHAIQDNKAAELVRIRHYAAVALGGVGRLAAPAVPALLEVLAEPEPAGAAPEARAAHADLRRAAVEALGAIGDDRAVAPLAKALDDAMTVTEVRIKDDRGERVVRQVKNVPLSRSAMSALNRFGIERKAVLPTLLRATGAEQDKFVRCDALGALGQLGRELGEQRKAAIAALRRGVVDKINEVRLAAILALGEMGPEVLGDELKPVRQELQLATRAPQKAISEAAEATLKQLEK